LTDDLAVELNHFSFVICSQNARRGSNRKAGTTIAPCFSWRRFVEATRAEKRAKHMRQYHDGLAKMNAAVTKLGSRVIGGRYRVSRDTYQENPAK
jgi:hypothetical protein